MATVPTGRMEREMRKYYLKWVKDLPSHTDTPKELKSYVETFKGSIKEIAETMGADVARLGVAADFPTPKMLDLSPHLGTVYEEIDKATIRAAISIGLNAKDTAQALMSHTVNKEYYKVERLARTETVSAYWKNQWDEVKGLDLVMIWSAEKGPRTCEVCLSKDGLVVPEESIRDHPNGRCTLQPMLPSEVKYRGTLTPSGGVTYNFDWKPKEEEKPVSTANKNRRETPEVDKLKRIAKSKMPKNLEQAVADGAANPKNARWIESKPGASKLDAYARYQAEVYDTNCTRVAAATEMRRRGFNVTAAPIDSDSDKSDMWIMDNWYDPLIGKTRNMRKRNSAKELMTDLEKFDDGARFMIAGPWKQGGAHIWNAEKIDGKVRFIEGQAYSRAGQDRTELYLKTLDFDKYKGTNSQVRWVRVDDLEPTDDIVEALRK